MVYPYTGSLEEDRLSLPPHSHKCKLNIKSGSPEKKNKKDTFYGNKVSQISVNTIFICGKKIAQRQHQIAYLFGNHLFI